MKVLEALGEPISYGGEEVYVRSILNRMGDADITLDILSPYYCDNEALRSDVRARGGDVYTLELPFKPGSLRLREKSRIRAFLQEHKYDAIHIHSGSNTMLAMYAELAKKAGIPKIIVHSHCSGKSGLKHKLAVAKTRRILNTCPTDYCACSTEAAVWRFSREACRNARIMKDGIDCNKFIYDETTRKSTRAQLGIAEETILLGCVGRLTFQKNQKFLIRMLPKLNQNYKLLLVGEGEDRSVLEQIAKEYSVMDRVLMPGTVNNVHEYMSAMDIFLFPSVYEGFGIVAIEAQANGLPVLASECVPKETALSAGITFLPLKEELWIEVITRSDGERNLSQADDIRTSGYDIDDTVREVLKLYGV